MLLIETLIVNLIEEVEKSRPLLKTFKRVLIGKMVGRLLIGYVCALITNPTI
jgi:hypothetical protein